MITAEAFRLLSRRLEDHHALFYVMWQMGRPVMDETIATACVRFNREGDWLEFAFNPEFWNSCTDEDRIFTIAHECLHVMLRHGVRTKDTKESERCNVALDLVVNHALVNTFGFVREDLTYWRGFCWVDTVFSEPVEDNLSFEDYFKRISPQDVSKFKLVDEHSSWSGDSDGVVKNVADKLVNQEKESLREVVENHSAGKDSGVIWTFVSVKVKPKKKWETVIKNWVKKYDRSNFQEIEQWARLNRRYVFLDDSLILPSDMEIEDDSECKIEVWFFQDTSNSCAEHRTRFFTAAKSLPKDRFDVKMHCFDTKVFETTLESGKLYGFGGTRYSPIEDYIQNHMVQNKTKYPQAVFLITDGWGDFVYPEMPERWHFFLTNYCINYVPIESPRHLLKDFE